MELISLLIGLSTTWEAEGLNFGSEFKKESAIICATCELSKRSSGLVKINHST